MQGYEYEITTNPSLLIDKIGENYSMEVKENYPLDTEIPLSIWGSGIIAIIKIFKIKKNIAKFKVVSKTDIFDEFVKSNESYRYFIGEETKMKTTNLDKLLKSRDKEGFMEVRRIENLYEIRQVEELDYTISSYLQTLKHELKDLDNLEYPILFRLKEGGKTYAISMVHYLYNLIMLRPYIVYDEPITREDLFDAPKFDNTTYLKYMNKILYKFKSRSTLQELSSVLADIEYDMEKICNSIGCQLGLSISIYDLIMWKKDSPDLEDILYTKIDPHAQISENEEFLNSQTKRLFNLINDDDHDHNILKPFVRAGQGMNKKQVREFMIGVGYKPDLQGNTVPITDSKSLLVTGLNSLESFYADAIGGRKAAVLQKTVGDSGYFSRMMSKLASSVRISHVPDDDCGSENYFVKYVKDEITLKMLEGRYYKKSEDSEKLKLVTPDSTHLIGKTIYLRTPVTCCSKHGICKKCYGKKLFNMNNDVNIGLIAAQAISRPFTQKRLSAKHVLDTNSYECKFDMNFDYYFNFVRGYQVVLCDEFVRTHQFTIIIDKKTISKDRDEVEDLSYNEYITKFVVRNDITNEEVEIHEESSRGLYISNQMRKLIKKYSKKKVDLVEIPMGSIDREKDLFCIRIENNELTKPLVELKDFVEKGNEIKGIDPNGDVNQFTQLINKLAWLLHQGGVILPYTHIEVIARNLIRDADNPLHTPDWSIPNNENYIITSLNKSILLQNSVIEGLTFEQIKAQIKDYRTYEKDGTSINDVFFINN